MRVVLERSHARITQMSELHFLYMDTGNPLRAVTLDGQAEIGLVEKGGRAADVVHGGYGKLAAHGIFLHLGGVRGQDDQHLSSAGETA